MNKPRLGYCCQNLSIPSQFKSTTVTWLKNNPAAARARIIDIARHNAVEYMKVINWNLANNCLLFRITSDFIPVPDHPDFAHVWDEIREMPFWDSVRTTTKRYLAAGGRLGTHPAQYCVISSERPEVRAQSIKHLVYHAQLLKTIGAITQEPFHTTINIHVSNGSKYQSAWDNTRSSLTEIIYNHPELMSLLVFETEENGCWIWQRLISLGQPIVLDFHHHRRNNLGDSWDEAFEACRKTWIGRPLCHHSEGRTHPLDKAHSDYILEVPQYDADIELECKAKDLAWLRLAAAK
jgi:UV DNA damage endonuclease